MEQQQHLNNDLFTPIGFIGAYSRSANLFQMRWRSCLLIVAFVFPLMLLFEWTAGLVKQDTHAFAEQVAASGGTPALSKKLFRELNSYLIEFFCVTFVDVWAKGILTISILDLYRQSGEDTTASLRNCARQALRIACPLFCTALAFEFILAISLFICFTLVSLLVNPDKPILLLLWLLLIVFFAMAAAYVIVPFLLFYPVMAQEQTGPMESIRRCYRLGSGHRCYLGCTLFLLLLVVVIIKSLIYTPGLFLQALASTIFVLIGLPISTILTTVVYMDLRVKDEGLTAQEIIDKDETEITEFNNDDDHDLIVEEIRNFGAPADRNGVV